MDKCSDLFANISVFVEKSVTFCFFKNGILLQKRQKENQPKKRHSKIRKMLKKLKMVQKGGLEPPHQQ